MTTMEKTEQSKRQNALAGLLLSFMHLVFPPVCAVCRERLDFRSRQHFCRQCSDSIIYLKKPLCRTCGMELIGEEDRNFLCGECLRSPPTYTLARSLVRYQAGVRQLVQKLKYGRDTSISGGISVIIDAADLSEFGDCRWILPVPLHRERHRQRGLNQATFLAGLFFPENKQNIRPDWLYRRYNTTPQTTLSGFERRNNLAGAFGIRSDNDLQNTKVCLVDDVYTTGTTVRECAATLIIAGVCEVKVLTLARVAVPQRGRNR